MKTILLILLGLLGCVLASCISSTDLADALEVMDRRPLQTGIGDLKEPSAKPVTRQAYAAKTSNLTLQFPVVYELSPAPATAFRVSRENLFGTAEFAGSFRAADIAGREFQNVANANFHLVQDAEASAALFSVQLVGCSLQMPVWSGEAVASLCIQVAVKKPGDSATAYSRYFQATCKAPWQNQAEVPEAFYLALDQIVENFLDEWGASPAVSVLLSWNGTEVSGKNGTEASGKRAPELKAIEWKQNDSVWTGRCEVACNGYEGFQAKAWANARIAQACRTKLGDLKPEHVRIVYDSEDYDEKNRKWSLVFRTFPRRGEPELLKAIEWKQEDSVWTGRCEVACNDYEGFEVKAWADARIAQACRTKLGDLGPERVQIAYDLEDYDKKNRKWTLVFRTFPRKGEPELKAIEWKQNNAVWIGRCEVACNVCEGFQAKAWANDRIAQACRTKLGNLDPERVQIAYDVEDYDAKKRKWTLVFRTFPRKGEPELKAIEWMQDDAVWIGRCEVECNDCEGFETKTWATARIAQACRTKLGDLKPEYVRIVYDSEDYDEKNRKWSLVFRTFPRMKVALSFNKITSLGQVTGDLELMNAKTETAAIEELKQLVRSQMDSFVGAVSATTDAPKGKALVRFLSIKTDPTYRLVTIQFKLAH